VKHAMGWGLPRVALFVTLLAVAAALLAPAQALAAAPDAFEPDDLPEWAGTLGVDQPSAQDRTFHGLDMDWMRVEVQAGVHYEFDVISRPGLVPANVRMTLWPAAVAAGGETWSLAGASTAFGAGTTTLSYTPSESGELYLQVELLDFAGEASYWLAAYSNQDWWDAYENSDLPPLLGTAYFCDGARLQRSLMPETDLDWFTVWVPNAGEYQIRTDFSSLGTPPDTAIEVWDSTGETLIAYNDNGAEGGPLSSVNVVAPSDSTMWRVCVKAAGEPSMGAYTFSAVEVPRTMGRVHGTITGPDGEVAGGALVELLGMDYAVLGVTSTASDGTYAFEGVPYDVPFRVRAQIENAGLVPALSPETRHLTNPEAVEGMTLGPEIPDLRLDLQVRRPWAHGWVYEDAPPYAALPGMTVTVYSLEGAVLGTGTTNANGTYYIELPAFTLGQCKLEARDPSGIRRTTWWWDSPDVASSSPADLPTFGGLSVLMPLSTEAPRNVLFDLGDVRITFDEITSPGTVTATPASPGNLPAVGFRMVPGRYYDIHPTLGFSGGATVTVTIPAEEASNASTMRLFHWEDGQWRDITTSVDPLEMTVTGRTTSFSDFSLQSGDDAVLEATAATPVTTLVALLVVASSLVLNARRGSRRQRHNDAS